MSNPVIKPWKVPTPKSDDPEMTLNEIEMRVDRLLHLLDNGDVFEKRDAAALRRLFLDLSQGPQGHISVEKK